MSKSFEDAVPAQMTGKQDTNVVTEKENSIRTNNAVRNTSGGKGPNGSKPADLQGMLISLLKDKPSGMTLKVLYKIQNMILLGLIFNFSNFFSSYLSS